MFVALLAAFVVAMALTAWAKMQGSPLHVLDLPNQRSLHTLATPRGGGVAVVAGILAGVGLLSVLGVSNSGMAVPVLAAIVLLTGVAMIDDRGHVSAHWRLLVQSLSAGLVFIAGLVPTGLVLPGMDLELNPLILGGMTFLFVLWMINLYNFMDGMDGFAGGMAVFGFGFLGLAGWLQGDTGFALNAWTVAVAALGFLRFNFPPAQIFMGDAGSTVLGFLAAVLILDAQQRGLLPLWCGILIFSPFIVDASVTLLRRLLLREAVWRAHRSHYYQRLVTLGWTHRRVVLWEYLLMLGCGISAIYVSDATILAQWAVVAAWILVYVMLAGEVNRRERAKEVPFP